MPQTVPVFLKAFRKTLVRGLKMSFNIAQFIETRPFNQQMILI